MNQTNLTVAEDDQTLKATIILQIVLFAVVCLLGLVGNTLVIYVVIRFSKMQTVTNMYIVNLAIADECFLIGIPFLLVTMINQEWIFGGAVCKAYMISTSITQFTSSIFLCIMSADRYIAVCHPISSPKWRTPMISRIVSVLAWSCSILLMTPIFEYATEEEARPGKKSCMIDWTKGENITDNSTSPNGPKIFTTYTFVFCFAIPLILILVFYCLVIQKLKTVGPKNKSKEKKRSHRKVTNLVLTVVTVYVFCWLPYWITQLASVMNSSSEEEEQSRFVVTLHLMASCLSYSNSAMNPILYAFLSDNFKKSFLKACTCAAGKDVNAALHLENSVFPRRGPRPTGGGSERCRRATSLCPTTMADDDAGPLVSHQSASGITMTSRTNMTSLTDSSEMKGGGGAFKNGSLVTVHPTCL